jgi:hypothetical protein
VSFRGDSGATWLTKESGFCSVLIRKQAAGMRARLRRQKSPQLRVSNRIGKTYSPEESGLRQMKLERSGLARHCLVLHPPVWGAFNRAGMFFPSASRSLTLRLLPLNSEDLLKQCSAESGGSGALAMQSPYSDHRARLKRSPDETIRNTAGHV